MLLSKRYLFLLFRLSLSKSFSLSFVIVFFCSFALTKQLHHMRCCIYSGGCSSEHLLQEEVSFIRFVPRNDLRWFDVNLLANYKFSKSEKFV